MINTAECPHSGLKHALELLPGGHIDRHENRTAFQDIGRRRLKIAYHNIGALFK